MSMTCLVRIQMWVFIESRATISKTHFYIEVVKTTIDETFVAHQVETMDNQDSLYMNIGCE